MNISHTKVHPYSPGLKFGVSQVSGEMNQLWFLDKSKSRTQLTFYRDTKDTKIHSWARTQIQKQGIE